MFFSWFFSSSRKVELLFNVLTAAVLLFSLSPPPPTKADFLCVIKIIYVYAFMCISYKGIESCKLM